MLTDIDLGGCDFVVCQILPDAQDLWHSNRLFGIEQRLSAILLDGNVAYILIVTITSMVLQPHSEDLLPIIQLLICTMFTIRQIRRRELQPDCLHAVDNLLELVVADPVSIEVQGSQPLLFEIRIENESTTANGFGLGDLEIRLKTVEVLGYVMHRIRSLLTMRTQHHSGPETWKWRSSSLCIPSRRHLIIGSTWLWRLLRSG